VFWLGSFVSFERSVGMILVLVSTHASCMSHPDVRSVAVTAQTRFLCIFTSMGVITPRFVRGQLLCKPDSRAYVLLCVSPDVRSSHVVVFEKSGFMSRRRALTKVYPTILLGTLVVFT
jgi:hypothetical protein